MNVCDACKHAQITQMDALALCQRHKSALAAGNQVPNITLRRDANMSTADTRDVVDRIFQPLEAYRVDHTGSELDMYRVTKIQFTRMKEEIRELLKSKA